MVVWLPFCVLCKIFSFFVVVDSFRWATSIAKVTIYIHRWFKNRSMDLSIFFRVTKCSFQAVGVLFQFYLVKFHQLKFDFFSFRFLKKIKTHFICSIIHLFHHYNGIVSFTFRSHSRILDNGATAMTTAHKKQKQYVCNDYLFHVNLFHV